MAGAVLAAIVLTILLPDTVRLGPQWLLPLIEGVLLVAVIAGDPGKINRRTRGFARFRSCSSGASARRTVGNFAADRRSHPRRRGDELGERAARSRNDCLGVEQHRVRASLLGLDGGGAAARAHQLPTHYGFAFPQQLNPRIASPDWRPRFIDYLYLGFTNATAFSPTDAMPLAPWAKIAMALQAFVSLAILGLVIARAVNVFT